MLTWYKITSALLGLLVVVAIDCEGALSQDAPVALQDVANEQDEPATKFELPQEPPDTSAGELVEWEGWSFRWQFRNIEGLMLNDVYFRGRKVLKSINLAEIYVPYAPGAPRPEDFSLGGFKANPMPLQVGRDCNSAGTGCKPFNRDGTPSTGPTADVMMHEEPIGFLYAGVNGRAPGKMLVLWSMVHFKGTDDGYTYVLRWKFRNDGSLCPEVGATGGLQHLEEEREPTRDWSSAKKKTARQFLLRRTFTIFTSELISILTGRNPMLPKSSVTKRTRTIGKRLAGSGVHSNAKLDECSPKMFSDPGVSRTLSPLTRWVAQGPII